MVAMAALGVNRLTAWLTQASDRVKSGRHKPVSVTFGRLLTIDNRKDGKK